MHKTDWGQLEGYELEPTRTAHWCEHRRRAQLHALGNIEARIQTLAMLIQAAAAVPAAADASSMPTEYPPGGLPSAAAAEEEPDDEDDVRRCIVALGLSGTWLSARRQAAHAAQCSSLSFPTPVSPPWMTVLVGKRAKMCRTSWTIA